MIKPSSSDYYAATDVVHQGRLAWSWEARLHQPHPWRPSELAVRSGWSMTRKRAERKADRAARRLMRAAGSWTSRTYEKEETRP